LVLLEQIDRMQNVQMSGHRRQEFKRLNERQETEETNANPTHPWQTELADTHPIERQ
jgi:hypothetical protein